MQGSNTASFRVHSHSFFTHRYTTGRYAVYTIKQKRNIVLPTTGHEGGVELYHYSFFNLGSRWRTVINATLRLLYTREKNWTCCTAGWVCTRASLDGRGKCLSPHRDSTPGPSRPYIVAIPTELSRPTTLSLEQQMKTVSSLSSLRSSPQCHTDRVHWRNGHGLIVCVT